MSTAVSKAAPALWFRYSTVAAICIAAIPLLIFPDLKWVGWLILSLVAIVLLRQYNSLFSRHMLLLVGAIGLLGITPINTDISYGHMLGMGTTMAVTVILPALLARKKNNQRIIAFPFRLGRAWYRREIIYVFFAASVSYFLLPFYLYHTNSYLNWQALPEADHLVRLFIGTNVLGIWDELFFVCVCLALLRQHIPFTWANLAQAALWTTFLYELGFRGWGPIAVFVFALSQGYIFKRSKSLLYVLTVHLTVDFILFLVIVHLHNPQYLRLFITSPF